MYFEKLYFQINCDVCASLRMHVHILSGHIYILVAAAASVRHVYYDHRVVLFQLKFISVIRSVIRFMRLACAASQLDKSQMFPTIL